MYIDEKQKLESSKKYFAGGFGKRDAAMMQAMLIPLALMI